MKAPALPAALRRTLRHVFGIQRLRPGQEGVIRRVLAGEDTLAIMPTGAGKSLCWQLPALHLPGTTVVVSPLIALMKDQAESLQDAGVGAEQINSARSLREQAASMARIARARSEVVFTTPEQLANEAFMANLARNRIDLLVVDEAHCISQWGHDFRPAFLEIGKALPALGDPPVLALTATATDAVVDDVRRQLGRPGMQVLSTGVYRPNLQLQVVQCVSEEEKLGHLLTAVRRTEGAGVVYCATVKACEALHERLAEAGESVAIYHGRLPAGLRHANQDRFMNGQARVMVATNAFGMGIDKADIRFVLHWQLPSSLEAYMHEAGRAGRDGAAARGVLLYWRRDRQVQQFFLAQRHRARQRLTGGDEARAERDREALERMVFYAQTGFCRWGVLLEYFDEPMAVAREAQDGSFPGLGGAAEPAREMRCGHCDNCLRPRPTPVPEQAAPQPSAAPAFRPGDAVRVPRYGSGRVKSATAEEVQVTFADGQERSFVAAYVEPAAG